MKIKGILLSLVLLLTMTGCRLAQAEQQTIPADDRLVGVFVTEDYLNLTDMDAWFRDHTEDVLQGREPDLQSMEEYQNRIWAELQDITDYNDDGEAIHTQKYVFPDLDGVFWYASYMQGRDGEDPYWTSHGAEGISEAQFGIHNINGKEHITMEGTIYVRNQDGIIGFYFNPVYQTPDGQVYLTGGNGTSCSNEDQTGVSFTHTMTEEHTRTENGEETGEGSEIRIQVKTMELPQMYVLHCMNADHGTLEEWMYLPGELPEELQLPAETAYVLLEIHELDGQDQPVLRYEVYDRQDEQLQAYHALENGICAAQSVKLRWEA